MGARVGGDGGIGVAGGRKVREGDLPAILQESPSVSLELEKGPPHR